MERVARDEFYARFPRREPATEMAGIAQGELTIGKDTCISGIVEGDVFVPPGLQLIVDGIVEGSVHVEPGATAYVHGTVEGDLNVHGAAFVDGEVEGIMRGDRSAVVHASTNGWVPA